MQRAKKNDINLTEHERQLILQYRKRIEMRMAVDRILDIEEKPPKVIQLNSNRTERH